MLKVIQRSLIDDSEDSLRLLDLPSFEASPNSFPDCLPNLYFCSLACNMQSKKMENTSFVHIQTKDLENQEYGNNAKPGDDSLNETK